MDDKQVIALLNSLIHSEDLKLKINIKDDFDQYVATASLTYKGRKVASVKNSKTKSYEE